MSMVKRRERARRDNLLEPVLPPEPSISEAVRDSRLAAGVEGQEPLVAHVIYRLDVGGLENGLVNLINRMPSGCYRHAIVCLTGFTDFRKRIRPKVPVYSMEKRQGNDLLLYFRLWRLLRRLRPDIVHTRNLATLEAQLPAFFAGVRYRVHGEHGRDVHDLDNKSRKYRLLRAAFRPLVQRYIPLSRDLEDYLANDVGVPAHKIVPICNGVDADLFRPVGGDTQRRAVLPRGFADRESFVIGTVGRLEVVKDQATLARAFVELVRRSPMDRQRLRLVIVGNGSLREKVKAILDDAGLGGHAWFPGSRDDIPQLLRSFDVFVLPSLGEGISNTILEAMATGLPVVATDVGGSGELVREGESGFLVPRADPLAMMQALERYAKDESLRVAHGISGRQRIEREFSLDRMVDRYTQVYDGLVRGRATGKGH